MRPIDADALMATLGITDMDCNKCAWHDREWSNCKRGGDFEDACCAIENAPTIDAIKALPSAQPEEVFEIGKPYPLKGYEFCIFKDAYGDDWVVIKKYINDIEEGQV